MARPKGVPNRNLPPLQLGEALKVPQVIQEEASGMTVSRLTLAQLLGTTPGSSIFKELVAASRFYGLTEGGINADEFSLTELGQKATGQDSSLRLASLKQAVMKVPPFQVFFETLASKKVPGVTAMREFLVKTAGVPEAHAEACAAHLLADAATAGLTRTISGAQWIDLEGVPREPATGKADDEDGEPDILEALAVGANGDLPADLKEPTAAPPLPPAPEEPTIPQAIFVAGRKGKSLDQLTKILDEYKIPYLLAEDEPNVGRPISIKVAQTMEKCGAAIIVFTPDEELRDLKGEVVWRPSQNMVHELGAAGMAYGNRIVIFREERVDLAANYSDIGHITFTEGELNAKGIELFRELIAFGLVKVTVGSG